MIEIDLLALTKIIFFLIISVCMLICYHLHLEKSVDLHFSKSPLILVPSQVEIGFVDLEKNPKM
jgi:hypothetical protein